MTMLQAVVNGNGSMAQFSHPELGGSGQWMRGGMTMVGDMFNYGLKSKVDGLCSELSQLLGQQPFVPPPASVQIAVAGRGELVRPRGARQSFGPMVARGARRPRTAAADRTRSATPISARRIAWRWT